MPNHYLEALDALAYSRPRLDPADYAGAYAPRTRPQHPTWTLLRLACAWTIMLAAIVAADYFIN